MRFDKEESILLLLSLRSRPRLLMMKPYLKSEFHPLHHIFGMKKRLAHLKHTRKRHGTTLTFDVIFRTTVETLELVYAIEPPHLACYHRILLLRGCCWRFPIHNTEHNRIAHTRYYLLQQYFRPNCSILSISSRSRSRRVFADTRSRSFEISQLPSTRNTSGLFMSPFSKRPNAYHRHVVSMLKHLTDAGQIPILTCCIVLIRDMDDNVRIVLIVKLIQYLGS